MSEAEYDAKVEAAVAKARAELAGGLADVDCGECGKWDGKSQRCECGGRRCYWESDEDAQGNVIVYPRGD